MTQMPTDLHHLLQDMVPLEGAFSPVLRLGPADGAALSLDRFTDDCVRRLMADAILDEPGGNAKLAAAYLMGTVSWSVCEPLVGLALRGLWLNAAAPDAISLSQRFVHWQEDGENGVSLAFDLNMRADGVRFARMPAPPGFAATLEQLHSPLITALHRLSGLSQAALFRLVSDSLALAFLEHGRAMGHADAAVEQARGLLRNRGSKLFNRQTDFEWISLPEAPQIGDWVRVRGGCCRYYTAPAKGAAYCTTCVLRDSDSRRERYRDYLRRSRV